MHGPAGPSTQGGRRPTPPPGASGGREPCCDIDQGLECWICHDALSMEPLVQPCRCRGSMAGVHASCVEAWVRCHRQDALHEPPRCPVCRAEYGGSDRHPGLRALAQQLAGQLLRTVGEAVRFLALVMLLAQYCADGGDGAAGSHAIPGLAAAALTVFLVQKVMVLSVSLPPLRPPPAGRLARRFFTTDEWCLARHVAEVLFTAMLLGIRCARGELCPARFLPVAVGALAPFMQLLKWYPVVACAKEAALSTAFTLCAPMLACLEAGHLAWQHRRCLVNPLDGAPHVALGLLAVCLCLGCSSMRPATVLFAAHAALLALGLLERITLQRLPWRGGCRWWCAVLVAVEVANLALGRWWLTLLLMLPALHVLQQAAARPRPQGTLEGPLRWCMLLVATEVASLGLQGVRGGPPAAAAAAGPAMLVWLCLLAGLACAVNWRRGLQHYHGWQRRHATFVLCTQVPGAAPSACAQPAEMV